MPEGFLHVKIDSKDFERAIERLPRLLQNNLMAAGFKVSEIVLDTEGLKRYPPESDANQPPAPYYIRGRGTQYADGRNSGTSEKYGTKWNTQVRPNYVRLGNEASYAQYLAGQKQPAWARMVGWRKILSVAREKMGLIKGIYQTWIDKAIRAAGFRQI